MDEGEKKNGNPKAGCQSSFPSFLSLSFLTAHSSFTLFRFLLFSIPLSCCFTLSWFSFFLFSLPSFLSFSPSLLALFLSFASLEFTQDQTRNTKREEGMREGEKTCEGFEWKRQREGERERRENEERKRKIRGGRKEGWMC